MATILCFGDSNTWGTAPHNRYRYKKNERWTGILQTLSGTRHVIIEQGQPNRTLVNNPPFEGEKSGVTYLKPCLEQHHPDLIIIMLGTNDLKARFNLSPQLITQGLALLIQQIADMTTDEYDNRSQVLILCPPVIHEVGQYKHIYKGGAEKSTQLAGLYQQCAHNLNCDFIDTNSVITSSPEEGIHWSVEQHHHLADTIFTEILTL